MTQRLGAPVLLVAITGACGAAVWFAPAASPERVLGGLLLGLVLPGAALSRLLAWEESYRRAGRLLLVPALSLAVVILDSLLLYVVGIRLDAHAWTISVGGVTLAAGVLGPLRAVSLPRPHRLRPAAGRLISLTAAAMAILLAGAVLVTIKGVRAQASADRFTQLWILPAAGHGPSATIGVLNHEGSRKSYQLDVFVDNHVRSISIVRLGTGRQWTTHLSFGSKSKLVQAALSLTTSPTVVYREVHLRLAPTVSPQPSTSGPPPPPSPSLPNSAP